MNDVETVSRVQKCIFEKMKLKFLSLPLWSIVAPIGACLLYLIPHDTMGTVHTIALAFLLCVTVIAAVHHAEVVAHRVGEPYGTLLLAIAVTIIEVSLVVSLMLAGGPWYRDACARYGICCSNDYTHRHYWRLPVAGRVSF